MAMNTIGGVDTVLSQELHTLTADFSATQTMEQFDSPLNTLKDDLKGIQKKICTRANPTTKSFNNTQLILKGDEQLSETIIERIFDADPGAADYATSPSID